MTAKSWVAISLVRSSTRSLPNPGMTSASADTSWLVWFAPIWTLLETVTLSFIVGAVFDYLVEDVVANSPDVFAPKAVIAFPPLPPAFVSALDEVFAVALTEPIERSNIDMISLTML